MKIIKLILVLLLFTGCSSKNINIEQLSNELIDNLNFEDELIKIDDNTIKKIYNIDNFINSYVYISSGATAEEIAIFEFANENEAKENIPNVEERITIQKDSFASYIPKEVKKLDNAIVKQYSKYLIVCITDDDSAQNIIKKYIS